MLNQSFKIGKHRVGKGHSVFTVVETGVTHNGNMKIAKELAVAAKEAGVDAIKYQTVGVDDLISNKDFVYKYKNADGSREENMVEMLSGLTFTKEQWKELQDYCEKEVGITFFSSVDYLAGIPLLESLNVPAHKVSSWDTNFWPFLQEIAKTKKPVLVDTGPANLTQVSKVVDIFVKEGNLDLAIVHTLHSESYKDMNLATIPFLQNMFGGVVGYSSGGRDNLPDYLAVAMGANIIEKRLTLNKNDPGHHHILSLEPKEMKEFIKTLRDVEASRGRDGVFPTELDNKMKLDFYRSIVAASDIPAGTTLNPSQLACKRPGTGIDPSALSVLTGRKTKRVIKKDQMISWDDV